MIKWQSSCLVLALAICAALAQTDAEEDSYQVTLEKYIQEHKQLVNPRYRLNYHLSAPVGWINDPNGFSFYNGEYHLFYQYHPYSAVWGPMHWGHSKSRNLIDWEYQPVALWPSEDYDMDGCFSGAAVDNDGELTLIYTGYVLTNDTDVGYYQNQNMATSSDGVTFEKYSGNSIIASPPDGNWAFRDPKIWRHEDYWYMVVGNPDSNDRGRVVIYRSSDLRDWDYRGVVAKSDGNLGYMWECPDFFDLGSKHVLLISPEGMVAEGDRYKNHQQVGYIVGDFDYEDTKFDANMSTFRELDMGHDFYAATTILAPDGRRILIAWMAMWHSEFPEKEDGWAGAMTIPRELRITKSNTLLMSPIYELRELREKFLLNGVIQQGLSIDLNTRSFELNVEADALIFTKIGLTFDIGGDRSVDLFYDPSMGTVTLDRGGSDGVRRAPWSPTNVVRFRIFFDSSSIEVFCGDGELVFTSRVYPSSDIKFSVIGIYPVQIEAYALRSSIHN